MAEWIDDAIMETAQSAPGLSAFALSGPVSALRSFVNGLGASTVCEYMAHNATKSVWEINTGTISDLSPDTLSRTFRKSSTGAPIDWQASHGTIYLTVIISAERVAQMRCHHRGATAPAAPLQLEMIWVDISGGVTAAIWKVCKDTAGSGTWITLWTINETTGAVTFPAMTVAGLTSTGAITMTAKPINEAKGANVASAATCDIWTPADGNTVHITGTTTITSFGTAPQAGAKRTLIFDGALTLTHGANLDLPGDISIATAAGDRCTVVADTTTAMMVTDYVRADGTPVRVNYTGVRQTVMGGPVDTAGLPTFLPSTDANLNLDSQNITSSAPLVVSSANGFNARGANDRIGMSVANVVWSSLTASRSAATPNFLYVIVNVDGTLTTGSTIVAPVYQWGGTPATTSGLITFNISEMKAYLGNGSTAPQTHIVLVGEAATDGSGVISTVAYAYNGRYDSGWTATLPSTSTTVSKNHNLGIKPQVPRFIIENTSTEGGYAVGDQVDNTGLITTNSSNYMCMSLPVTRNTVTLRTGGTNKMLLVNQSNSAALDPTAANWRYKFTADRGW